MQQRNIIVKNPVNPIVSEDIEGILAHDLPWSDLNGSVVLISGISGFLAAYIAETLAELNNRGASIRVVGLVRNMTKASSKLGHLVQRGVELISQDISCPLHEKVPYADYIIHAASQASPKFYGVDPVGTIMANTMGTSYLLKHAVASNSRRFLYFSSGEVYGIPLDSDQLVSEDDYGFIDPMNVRSCYAESKRMGETMCVSWAHQYGLHTSIVRPFHTYGPGIPLDDGRVFCDFVADVIGHRNIILKSDGAAIRPFCYIADATIGFFTVLLKGGRAEAFNVGNPQAETSILNLAIKLAELFPERNLKIQHENLTASNSYLKSPISRSCPSIEKIRNLNWFPKVGIEDGFRRTILSFE